MPRAKKKRSKQASGKPRAGEATARDVVFVELKRTDAPTIAGEVWRGEYLSLDGSDSGRAQPVPLGPGETLAIRDCLDAAHTNGLLVTSDPEAVRAALGPARSPDVLDIAALAKVAMPGLASFETCDLMRLVGGDGLDGTLRAQATRDLWMAIWREVMALPLAALTELTWLLQLADPALAEVFRRAEAAARNTPGVDDRPMQRIFKEGGEKMRKPHEARIIGDPRALGEDEVDEVLGTSGAVSRNLDNYEDRPQQRRMAKAVASAFSSGRHLMAEGGTGVGKSLAYLVPAVLWATRNGRPVVVSTHTKNLQSQLFEKDLPLLRRAIGTDFRVAVIKGRRNYLCVRKLLQVLRAADYELDIGERRAMASVVSWAVRTPSGDLSENVALQFDGSPALTEKITSLGYECPGRRCSHFGQCFLQAMRAAAMEAHVVIANHALVFAELGARSVVLPEHGEIVFDEAHHVEDVATEHLGAAAARIPCMRVLARLFRLPRGGPQAQGGTGLLATVFHEVAQAESALEGTFGLQMHEAARLASEYVRTVSDAVDEFFSASSDLLGPGAGERRVRYREEGRTSRAWQNVFDLGKDLSAAFGELAGRVDRVAEALGTHDAKPITNRREIAMDLRTQAAQLEEAARNIAFVLSADNEAYVYWLEEDPSASRAGPFARFAAAPIEIAPLIKAQLLDQKRSCVFTSATLTVGGSFDYLRDRLGLGLSDEEAPVRTDALSVGSPFDYDRQALVLVPRFLPDPRDAGAFTEKLSDLCIDLFMLSQGRGMVLFTSYAMLKGVREILLPELGKAGIRVLAQGRDGSRESMLDELRKGQDTVLLGTASFWEGVDVPGEALSVLVVAKLPFHVFTEPIIQARCEAIRQAGEDPFSTYTLPAAVLRLRQGFGRLIRSTSDRGIVVIADPRVTKAGYGRAFMESLPTRAKAAPDPRALLRAARTFLEVTNGDA
jgi:Rad3-related DNA helicase